MVTGCDLIVMPLALQIHRVKKLILHLALADGVGALQQSITQRGLAMVDVRIMKFLIFEGSICRSNKAAENTGVAVG